MTKFKIYFLKDSDEEIYMFGDYIGIVWDLEEVTKTTVNETGHRQKVTVYERTGEKYIGFPIIRGNTEEDYYLDDDKSIDGGLSLEAARQVAQELTSAVEYLESL